MAEVVRIESLHGKRKTFANLSLYFGRYRTRSHLKTSTKNDRDVLGAPREGSWDFIVAPGYKDPLYELEEAVARFDVTKGLLNRLRDHAVKTKDVDCERQKGRKKNGPSKVYFLFTYILSFSNVHI